MKIRAFITHKKAERFKDCQDRFSINMDTKSVAVADGMSQSYQQKIWASLLVEQYTSHHDFVPNHESIKELSAEWISKVKEFIENLKENGAPQYLVIMNENSLVTQKSAGATFLGIRFSGQKWEGDVLGDSCLVEVKNGRIERILTSQQEDEFDNHPDYFDSGINKEGKGTPKIIDGVIDENTKVLLVSDPFSDFLNEKKKIEEDGRFIAEILQLTNHDEYEALVSRWRDEYGMHNDDSTLIIIEDDKNDMLNVVHSDDINDLIEKERAIENNEHNIAEKQEIIENSVRENESQKEMGVSVCEEPIVNSTESKNVSVDEDEFIKEVHNAYDSLETRNRKNVPFRTIKLIIRKIFVKFKITRR